MVTNEAVEPVTRTGFISIKAHPEPGEGRWAPGLFARPEYAPDVVTLPSTSPFEREGIRFGLVAALMQVDAADGIGAAVAFLLSEIEKHPHVAKTILSAEVTRGSVRCRIIDALSKGVR